MTMIRRTVAREHKVAIRTHNTPTDVKKSTAPCDEDILSGVVLEVEVTLI